MRKFLSIFLTLVAATCLLTGCDSGHGDKDLFDWLNQSHLLGKFVYVNHDGNPNYVSAFAIQEDGTLAELENSPYITGGGGANGGYYASNAIALAPASQLLFVSNKADDTVSAFTVDTDTGALTAVGEPVASGGDMAGGGSLAVNDTEDLLFVGHDGDNTISVLTIAADGTLTPVAGSPFDIGAGADGITLNAVGSLLYVAAPNSGNVIVVLNIAADGTLTPIDGSPFAYTEGGSVTSFALASETLGIAGATGGILSSYLLDENGAPTLIEALATGDNNNQAVTLSPDGSVAFLSGGSSAVIGVVTIAADGTLAQVDGSPFATSANTTGYAAVHPDGAFLYATEQTQIEAFTVDANGTPTSLGVYPLTNPGYTTSVIVY